MTSLTKRICVPALAAAAVLLWLASRASADSSSPTTALVPLHDGWALQSSCKVQATGAQISIPGFSITGWHKTSVPSTVLAALVADGTYADPYFGENLRSIPGTNYPIGKDFSLLPMPKDSPFRCSWWYRIEFATPKDAADERVWLDFDGINDRANIWLNGRQIAGSQAVAGMFRSYEFDVSRFLRPNGPNALAVETIAQTPADLGIGWNDWNPMPPDKDMGLWRGVSLRATGVVKIEFPAVGTHFPRSSLDQADLTVIAQLRNDSAKPVSGVLEANLEGHTILSNIVLHANETRDVRLTPDAFPELRVRDPQLWWPRQMGTPALRQLSLRFLINGKVSDAASTHYGIRDVSSELDAQGHRAFRVNGKKLLIRGGEWAPDMMLRESGERMQAQFAYINDLNLNAIRLEGKLESDDFYDLADEEGVLIIAGWNCCDFWMQWPKWKPADIEIAAESLRSQILRMRSHPSMLVWLNGSDEPPPGNVERAYIKVLHEAAWPNPYLSSASADSTPMSGPTGVKMAGPYDYVPPDYWLSDTKNFGGAFGFATEISPGPAIPPFASLRQMLPAADTLPGDPVWNYHAGGERFTDLRHFDEAMRAIYGPPHGIDDYERKAQAMAYDSERAMFEAYSRNKYRSTGVIQWMLNNAWPSLIWHLWDYYLQPAGGYFGTKKACELLHVQYSYDNRSVAVVNSTYQPVANLTASVEIYDADLRARFLDHAGVSIAADSVADVLTIPEKAFEPASAIFFMKLTLEDADGTMVSRNFYWLSPRKNVYDWSRTDAYTEVSSYEDLTALQSLPKVGSLTATAIIDEGSSSAVHVQIENPTDHLAFQIHLGIRHSGDTKEILPVLWDDNYISLLPHESREITARFRRGTLPANSELIIDGWNIQTAAIPVKPAPDKSTKFDGAH